MRVTQVEITDIRSITHMVLKPGALVVISGNNGQGKTSILLAIASVFEGGHNPTIRRDLDYGKTGVEHRFARKGEVKLTLDNGTVITRTITEKSSTLKVDTLDGLPVPDGPQHYVETLASGFGFDPIQFCDAKPKERLAYLQKALNISFTPDEVATACGMKPAAAIDLDGLDLIRKQVFETRTKVNGMEKQARGTVQRLSDALAEDETKDWDGEAKRIQAERDVITDRVAAGQKQVMQEANAARKAANLEFEQEVAKLRNAMDVKLTAIDTAEREACTELKQVSYADVERLTVELGAAQERARKGAQIQVFRGEVKQAEKDAAQHKTASEALTAKLERIDELKKQKLESLPIPGVDLRGGQFFVEGTPFDDLNTGEQYLRAFQIGALQPGSLGIMVADRSETLGPDAWEVFKQAAVMSGFQVLTTRVTSGPLKVETFESQPELTLQ